MDISIEEQKALDKTVQPFLLKVLNKLDKEERYCRIIMAISAKPMKILH